MCSGCSLMLLCAHRSLSISRDGTGKKWWPHISHTKSYAQNSALIIIIGFYEPYHDISSVSISNKAVSGAGKLRWGTRPASRYTRGVGRNRLYNSSCFFLQPG